MVSLCSTLHRISWKRKCSWLWAFLLNIELAGYHSSWPRHPSTFAITNLKKRKKKSYQTQHFLPPKHKCSPPYLQLILILIIYRLRQRLPNHNRPAQVVKCLPTERTAPIFCTQPFIYALFVDEVVAGETSKYRVVGHVVEAERAGFGELAV